MRVRVKICGLTTTASVAAATDAGADAIGFVFADSPRRVTPQRAAELGAAASPLVTRVGVFHHPAEHWISEVLRLAPLDAVQTDWDDVATGLGSIGGRPLVPVFRDGASLVTDVPQWLAASPPSPTILVEGPRSGSGRAPDWRRIASLPRTARLILAGGLTPDNVAQAIALVRPHAVDVSSGVESAPGVKDPARIRDFIAAVRAAELKTAPADRPEPRP